MNILVLSWRDPKHPLAGGAEQVMHEHMKGWISAGHQVTLFSSHFKKGKRWENLDGIIIIRYGFQYCGVHILGFIWYLFGNHQKFDLVVDQFHGIPFFTPLYIKTPKLAVLQEVAREVWFLNQLPKPFNFLIGAVGYILEPVIFLFYKRVLFMTGSASAKDDLANFGVPTRNIIIVPHGVIIKKPKFIPKKEKRSTIAYLGVLSKDKGVEEAIKTFGILNKGGDYNFWIIGKGSPDYVLYLRTLAEKLNISGNIRFWGFVPMDKKFELLARAHLLVNPSVREGWGLVNIEANSMGTPVVAYRSPGLVDSVKSGLSGIICIQNTPEEMAEIIENLLQNRLKYQKLILGAISWSKNFSWEKSRKLSLALINRL